MRDAYVTSKTLTISLCVKSHPDSQKNETTNSLQNYHFSIEYVATKLVDTISATKPAIVSSTKSIVRNALLVDSTSICSWA